MLRIVNYNFTWQFTSWQQTSFWPEDEENGGSELTTMSSQLRKTRSMDSSCLELRLGPLPGNPQSSGGHLGPTPHLPAVLSRARSEANLHASTLSLGPGTLSCCSCFLSFFFFCDNDIDFRATLCARAEILTLFYSNFRFLYIREIK